jgi:hypothetical protein
MELVAVIYSLVAGTSPSLSFRKEVSATGGQKEVGRPFHPKYSPMPGPSQVSKGVSFWGYA